MTIDQSKSLIDEIRAICTKHGIAETTFGRHAVNDGKFVSRLDDGRWVANETKTRVYDFIERMESGDIKLRGRPKRKKDQAHDVKMADLISEETSVRTAGSLAFHEQGQRRHVFNNTTNEAWVLADFAASELEKIKPGPDGLRIFYAPMDSGIALTRILRAVHARHPDLPVLVVLKGRGLEDLRNTMGRLVDRLAEHPLTVITMTNMYLREAVDLTKRSDDNPADPVWRDVVLDGVRSYDFQCQVSEIYGEMAEAWQVDQGQERQPVYAIPSVVTIYRTDQADKLQHIIPREGDDGPLYDYALLNQPYLHTHTMTFRTDFTLAPVVDRLAPDGRMTVIQSLGNDPAHEIVQRMWPDQPLHTTNRFDIIKAFRKTLGDGPWRFSGLTDTNSLFRFDMHTLPILPGRELGTLSLTSAWNNAVYFAQVREDLAQAAINEGTKYLDVTRDVLQERGGLWFVNETFSVTRTG